MDIYDYAMKFEKDGEAYYRDAAAKSAHKGFGTILTMLADIELQHYQTFEKMKANEPVQVKDTNVLDRAKNIFIKMREEGGGMEGLPVREITVYKRAQEIEKETETFYREKAKELKGKPQEMVFLHVAEEENRHYWLLQRMIDFVDRPHTWLVTAEWTHHADEDEY